MKISELRALQNAINGEVLWEDEILDYYSCDASFYQIKPKLVTIPKIASDIPVIMEFAKNNNLSVTPRGGGTGLVGGALNDGIILDLQKFNKIKASKNYVTVGAGVHKGQLDIVLRKQGKFLGPNPSVGPYCTIGGMIATNASGSHSLKYGSVIDNLLEVTIINGRGEIIRLPSKMKICNSVLYLAHSIEKNDYPRVSKNSCGYRLDAVTNRNDLHKIIAGSEGTLGVIISAKLKIYREPKNKILSILGYESISKAVSDCLSLVKLNPSALEFVDNNTMKNFEVKFPDSVACLLFIEFDSETRKNLELLKKNCTGRLLKTINHKKSITKWWKYRNSALYFSLRNLSKGESLPHIIEDAAVPIEKLGKLILLAQKISKKFQAKLVMYGHAGNGNIHIRLASKNNSKKLTTDLSRVFFDEVIKMGGTITGEHGDGIARTKFVKLQYGTQNYSLFTRLKKEFDPDLILNPGKIVKSLIQG